MSSSSTRPVAKVGSDVNQLFFHILPGWPPGVLVHLHDITCDFEYPREWLEEGRAWNEQYLLRAFLMNNAAYRIELMTARILDRRQAWFREHLPLALSQGGGGRSGCGN